MKFYDVWGTDQTYPHYAVGWAWAWDTPYQWTKEVASHFGGTRNGMAMAWPARIKDEGGIRHQFHHVIDIVPTILEAAGLPEPVMVNGVAQRPIEGVSMAYTWDNAECAGPADDPVLRDVRLPRDLPRRLDRLGAAHRRALGHLRWTKPPADVMNGFKWELYNLNEDWTQANDLAAKMPDKLRDMQQLFTMEADEVPRVPARRHAPQPGSSRTKPSYTPGRTVFTYSGELTNVPFPGTGGAPSLLNRSYTITAEIEIPAGRRRGHAGHRRRPLRRLRLLPAQGPAGVHLEPDRSWSASSGRARRRSRRASTRSSSTGSTTARASARAAPAP